MKRDDKILDYQLCTESLKVRDKAKIISENLKKNKQQSVISQTQSKKNSDN